MIQEAIILAGGLGTRLQKMVSSSPKSMALINGKPFLEYQLDFLSKNSIQQVILSVGYKNEMIRNHFKEKYDKLKIKYAIEKEPLGTGGATKNAFRYITGEEALVLNGDSIFNVDVRAFYSFFLKKKAKICLALRKMDEVCRYGTVIVNKDHRIIAFKEKTDRSIGKLINGGCYIINKSFYSDLVDHEKFSIEKDIFEKIIDSEGFFGFESNDYFIDIGIPEDYIKAQDEFKKFQ
ncbi:nucleotidyltransferase family protein [Bacteroidota bacterium]